MSMKVLVSTDSCAADGGLIDYTRDFYCTFEQNALIAALLIVWLLYLLLALALVADEFFCPTLEVMCEQLRLPDNIAGVSLLAFGNGAPDVFTAIASASGAQNGQLGLTFGALIGAGIFVTTIVPTAVGFLKPFKANERPLLRDIVFYLVASFWLFTILFRGHVTLLDSIGLLLLYLMYALVVIFGRLVRQRLKKKRQQRLLISASRANIQEVMSESANNTSPEVEGNVASALDINHAHNHGHSPSADLGENSFYSPPYFLRSHSTETAVTTQDDQEELIPGAEGASGFTAHLRIQLQLLRRNLIQPFSVQTWRESSHFSRGAWIVKLPLLIAFNVTIPTQGNDCASNPSRCPPLMRLLHIFTVPFVVIISFQPASLGGPLAFDSFKVWHLLLASSLALALVYTFVVCVTRKAHVIDHAFVWFGFVASVSFINSLANEVVDLLETFGVVLNISNAILGLTILAWGNSLGDVVSDTTLSRAGRPQMAFGAVFGGLLFNLCIGIGIAFSLNMLNSNTSQIPVQTEAIDYWLILMLGSSLLTSLVYFVVARFQIGRIYSGLIGSVYIVFIVGVILIETNVLP